MKVSTILAISGICQTMKNIHSWQQNESLSNSLILLKEKKNEINSPTYLTNFSIKTFPGDVAILLIPFMNVKIWP